AIHGPRLRAHGVLLSRDTGLVRATAGLGDLLYLQHVIGNRKVQGLLVARQQSTAEGPLSPAQVRDAIVFYRAQPARYTRDIIMEIQQAVGTDPTGRISAVDEIGRASCRERGEVWGDAGCFKTRSEE